MVLSKWVSRPHRWRELVDLIDELPSACRLRGAILNDPEEAAAIVAEEESRQQDDMAAALGLVDDEDGDPDRASPTVKAPSWRPRDSEWDVHAIALAKIDATLLNLSSKILKPKGHRAPPAEAYLPAPRTLVDDLRDLADRSAYEQGMSVFAPDVAA
ncbi:hypothetical protein [Serinicoccus sediminis]|uniref:hypothetical protein n=1 Tax=Serinicoccus sediminis TaxID=2306021 RepID=UPI0010229362|nr:hypothetical protein [Serinicoccus sediminis]